MLRKLMYSLGALAMLAIAVGRRVQAQLGITARREALAAAGLLPTTARASSRSYGERS